MVSGSAWTFLPSASDVVPPSNCGLGPSYFSSLDQIKFILTLRLWHYIYLCGLTRCHIEFLRFPLSEKFSVKAKANLSMPKSHKTWVNRQSNLLNIIIYFSWHEEKPNASLYIGIKKSSSWKFKKLRKCLFSLAFKVVNNEHD